jgi:hypothetical protein
MRDFTLQIKRASLPRRGIKPIPTLLFLLLFLFPPAHRSTAAVFPDRGILPARFSGPPRNDTVFLDSVSGWAEISRYPDLISDDEHRYNVRTGLYFELLNRRNRIIFDFMTDVELAANRHSDIGFNPRSFFWDESLAASLNAGNVFPSAGYTHRCKHDIDNLDIYEEKNRKVSRVLVYDSVFVRISSTPLHPFGEARNGAAVISLRYDQFTLVDDYRRLAEGTTEIPTGRERRLISSLSAGLFLSMPTSGKFSINSRLALIPSLYSGGVVRCDEYAELSAGLTGRRGALSLFVRYEHQHDTGINPFVEDSDLFMAGIRCEGMDFLPANPR